MDSELVSQHSPPYSPGAPYLMYVDCMCDDSNIMAITPWMTKGGLGGLAGGPAGLGCESLVSLLCMYLPSRSLLLHRGHLPLEEWSCSWIREKQ